MGKSIAFYCFVSIILSILALVYSIENILYKSKDIFAKSNLYPANKVECLAICSKLEACSMIVISPEQTKGTHDQLFYTCNSYQITQSTNMSISDGFGAEIWYKIGRFRELMHDLAIAPTKPETTDARVTDNPTEVITMGQTEVTTMAQTGCPPSFMELDAGCYHADITQRMTWTEAEVSRFNWHN